MARNPENSQQRGNGGGFDLVGHKERLVRVLRNTINDRSPTAQIFDVPRMRQVVDHRGGVTSQAIQGSAVFFDAMLEELRVESNTSAEELLGQESEISIHTEIAKIWRRSGIVALCQKKGINIEINSAFHMQGILRHAFMSGFETGVPAGELLSNVVESVTDGLIVFITTIHGRIDEKLRKSLHMLVVATVNAGARVRNSQRGR